MQMDQIVFTYSRFFFDTDLNKTIAWPDIVFSEGKLQLPSTPPPHTHTHINIDTCYWKTWRNTEWQNQSTEIPLLSRNSVLKRIKEAIQNDQEKLLFSNFITRFLGKEQVPLDVCLCSQVDMGIML